MHVLCVYELGVACKRAAGVFSSTNRVLPDLESVRFVRIIRIRVFVGPI